MSATDNEILPCPRPASDRTESPDTVWAIGLAVVATGLARTSFTTGRTLEKSSVIEAPLNTSELPGGPEEAHVLGYPRGATVADSSPRVGRRLREFSPLKERSAELGARDCSLPGNGPIRTPSLEVVNVAGDSAIGRDRIQSAPNLRRVHAESA
jgi:hypothetical protein